MPNIEAPLSARIITTAGRFVFSVQLNLKQRKAHFSQKLFLEKELLCTILHSGLLAHIDITDLQLLCDVKK